MSHPERSVRGTTNNDQDTGASPRGNKRRTSDHDRLSERKRSHEEMRSQDFMVSDSMRVAYSGLFPPFAGSSPSMLASRSTFMQEQFDAPLPGISAVQASAAATATGRAAEGKTTAEEQPSAVDFAAMSRSERKRYREKKRRGEVNKGFEDLLALLLKVDPTIRSEVEQESEKSNRRGRAGHGEGENPVLNRVDLITRTIEAIKRMNRENERQREMIEEMSQGGTSEIAAARRAIKDDRVLLMIPFLTPSGPVVSTRSSAADTPFSTQQALGLPATAAAAAQNAAAMGPNAAFQNMPFSPLGYPHSQPADSMPRYAFRGPLQGYDGGFNQAYYRPMQDTTNAASGLNPDPRDAAGRERGPML